MNLEVPPVSSLIKKYICRPPESIPMALISIVTMQGTSELSMGETLPKTIVFREANYLSWRLLINKNYDRFK